MKVDKELILKVAENARLRLSNKEVEEFLPQLQEILDAFSKLEKVDVKDIEPSFQPIKMSNVFREDKKENCLGQEDALSNTKHKKDGYFKGPRII